jgi:hypothetical protein
MIRKNNKRDLYESIMSDVAKTVKRHINESSYEPFSDDELDSFTYNENDEELEEAILDILKYDLSDLFDSDPINFIIFFYLSKKWNTYDDELANQFVITFINNVLLDEHYEFKRFFDQRELLAKTLNCIYNNIDLWSNTVVKYLENYGIEI